jgi:molecular chaperone GrpE
LVLPHRSTTSVRPTVFMEALEKDDRRADSEARTANNAAAEETERLKEELHGEHDKLLRALADFDNYRRRVERDRASAVRAGKREVILPLLEVLDGFERALGHVGAAPASVAQGVQALHRNLLSVLERQGVTAFDSVGENFDPRFHDAIGTVESAELESGTVAEDLQRGYRWGDEVLRPARVRVAG